MLKTDDDVVVENAEENVPLDICNEDIPDNFDVEINISDEVNK